MQMGMPVFAIFMAYAAVNTYLPLLLSSLGYSPLMIGILQSMFELSGVICPLFFCSLVDRRRSYGIAMMIFAGVFLTALPVLRFGYLLPCAVIGLTLLAAGMRGIVPVSDAFTSILLKDRQDLYGTVRVLGSVGFVVAVLSLQIGRFVDDTSPASMLFWMGVPAVIFLAVMLFHPSLLRKVPEPEPPAVPVPDLTLSESCCPVQKKHSFFSDIAEFSRTFWFGIALIFLGWLGLVPSQKFFSLYVRDGLGLDCYALLWAVSASSEIPVMYFSGIVIRRAGVLRTLGIALGVLVIRNAVYAFFPSFGGAFAGQLCHSLSYGLLHPAAVVFISEQVKPPQRVLGMTVYTAVAVGLASAGGNILGGLLIEHRGYMVLFSVFSLFPAAGVLLYVLFGRKLYR